MPSGPPELPEKWCNAGPYHGFGDSNALDYLKRRGITAPVGKQFKFGKNGVFKIPKDRTLIDDEESALDYLCMEWDYAVERI